MGSDSSSMLLSTLIQKASVRLKLLIVLWIGCWVALFLLLVSEDYSPHRDLLIERRKGYWGEPTASVDFCEENYAVTPYIAEFWNTISSLYFLCVSGLGLWLCVSYKLEARYIVAYVAAACVGAGSALFHATLLHSMQLLDEFPMVWAVLSGIFLIDMIDVKDPSKHPSARIRWLPVSLFFSALSVTLVELLLSGYPELFQILFSGFASYLVGRGIQLSLTLKHAPSAAWMLETSMFCYLFGCQLWVLEGRLCNTIAVLQLHAWWHIFSCLGFYLFIMWSKKLRFAEVHNVDTQTHWGPIPYITPVRTYKEV